MAIDIQEAKAGVLEPVDHHRGEAAHEVVAQAVIGLALAAQARAVEGHRAHIVDRTRVEVPDVGREEPRPADYLAGVTQEQFFAPGLIQDAILRQLIVAGEAAYKTSPEFQQWHPEIPWQKIAGFRHRAVHDYFGIDLDAVWRIATVELPLLRSQVLSVIAAEFPLASDGQEN